MLICHLPLLVILLSFTSVAMTQFCVCSETYVVVATSADCFKSGDYGLQNACFNCPVTLSGGSIENRCMSLPREGYRTCNQADALKAMQDACRAMGGNTGSPEFKCSTSLTGSNTSQIDNCVTTPPTVPTQPTSPTSGGSTPTEAPTSSASGPFSTGLIYLVTIACILFYTLLV